MVLCQAMRFKPHAVEQAWQHLFNSSKRLQDVTTAFINTALLCMPLPFCDPDLLDAGTMFYLLQMVLSSLAVISLSYLTPAWYLRNRNSVILTRQVVTLLAFQEWILPSPFFSFLHPLGIPGNLVGKLRAFLIIPLLLLHATLSHPMPLHSKRFVMAISTYIAIKYNYGRCAAEMVRFENAGKTYSAALTATDTFIRRWLPLHSEVAIPRAPTDAAMLSDFGACVAAHSIVQLALGVFFPAAVLAAEETLSRKAFERHHALSTAFTYTPKVMLALNLLVVPVEALIAFHCVARAIAMIGEVNGGPVPAAAPS